MMPVTSPTQLWGTRRPIDADTDLGVLDSAGRAAVAELLMLSAASCGTVLARLRTSRDGLTETEAAVRLNRCGVNQVRGQLPSARGRLLAGLRSPFVGLLTVLDGLVLTTRDWQGAGLLLTMLLLSVGLRWRQHGRFDHLAMAMRSLGTNRTAVLRRTTAVPAESTPRRRNPRLLVPGDVIHLTAGDVVPADCRLLDEHGLVINEAILTGESVPVRKSTSTRNPQRAGIAAVLKASTLCFSGSRVMAGTAWAVVAATGPDTVLGVIVRQATRPRRATHADLGLRRVSWLLIQLLALCVPAVFLLTALRHGVDDLGDAALFVAAMAVGLVPEMLPVVLATAQGRGLTELAARGVLVTRPGALQDLAALDVLCTDKTGTLTVGQPVLAKWLGPDGEHEPDVLEHAVLAATFADLAAGPLDTAILDRATSLDIELAEARYERIGRPTDTVGGCVVLTLRDTGNRTLTLVKGPFCQVLKDCTHIRSEGRDIPADEAHQDRLDGLCRRLRRTGHRVQAIAFRPGTETAPNSTLVLLGILAFLDPPRPGASAALAALQRRNVRTVMVTGDSVDAATGLCAELGIPADTPVTGTALDHLDDRALTATTARTAVFAEVDPLQKARIVRAFRAAGHTVGYLADGINDTPALRAADVGISLTTATAVARHAADAVLLDANLDALEVAVVTSRHAILNATKYLKATLTANFSTVLSMLAAAIVLPFPPMLPTQMLAQNLIYDLAALTLPADRVDPEQLDQPHRWSISDLVRFMCWFAPLSTLFDLVTFWVLLHVFHAGPGHEELFATGWFLECLLTQVLGLIVIRTRRLPLLRGRPAALLTAATLIACGLILAIPRTALAETVGLAAPPTSLYLFLALVTPAYLVALQLMKMMYSRVTHRWL
ncbi:MAG: magnesium-translocating P-type ATPase [Actinocatenispora sp.]